MLIFTSIDNCPPSKSMSSRNDTSLTTLALGPVHFRFSAGFFSRKVEKLKAETNGKLFNWLLER
jgi:hypothetical protein